LSGFIDPPKIKDIKIFPLSFALASVYVKAKKPDYGTPKKRTFTMEAMTHITMA